MKKRYASYFLLAVTLFIVLNLPSAFTSGIRGRALFAEGRFAPRREDEVLQLKIENRKLKEDLEEVRNWVLLQDRLEGHIKRVEELLEKKGYGAFYQRRIRDLLKLLEKEAYAVDAKVIFRDPAFWGSGFWIDKGERENRSLGTTVIAKNSPVLCADSLIGVVEKVEERRSYVRLITDSALTPSVRAIRGSEQYAPLLQNIAALEEEPHLSPTLLEELDKVKQSLQRGGETLYLAKGELRGSSYPLWRSRSSVVKGVGFNYEFADEEGPFRTLHEKGKEPLLAVGDLLITSGLDGIFPAGLLVAHVSKISSLKEGDFAYELQAHLTAGSLDRIHHVQIYPPL